MLLFLLSSAIIAKLPQKAETLVVHSLDTTVEPRLSELMGGGKGCSYNQTVHKIELPYIYIQSFAQLL